MARTLLRQADRNCLPPALWWLLSVWLGANGGWWALAGSLAWALHPLHTSAITYVSGRADPLAAIFIFCGLALIAKAHARGALVPGDRAAARGIILAAVRIDTNGQLDTSFGINGLKTIPFDLT